MDQDKCKEGKGTNLVWFQQEQLGRQGHSESAQGSTANRTDEDFQFKKLCKTKVVTDDAPSWRHSHN